MEIALFPMRCRLCSSFFCRRQIEQWDLFARRFLPLSSICNRQKIGSCPPYISTLGQNQENAITSQSKSFVYRALPKPTTHISLCKSNGLPCLATQTTAGRTLLNIVCVESERARERRPPFWFFKAVTMMKVLKEFKHREDKKFGRAPTF